MAQRRELQMRERQASDWSPVIDIMFASAVPWPTWHDDALAAGIHGVDDDNPHVWLPVRDQGWIEERVFRRCTCGMSELAWYAERDAYNTMSLALYGLISRDVQ